MLAASPPLTRRAITTTMAAIHSRADGGTANITIANTTNAARTPVRRTGLLAVDGAVFAAKVGPQEHEKGLEEAVPIEVHLTCSSSPLPALLQQKRADLT